MKKLSLEELKQVELEMLIYLHEICEKHDIKYALCGGTLLGAIRHKGFIPWDDDIDVNFIRPEYEKLVKVLKNDDKYLFLEDGRDGNYYPFGKLIDKRTILTEHNAYPIKDYGVYIDIFPVDGLPSEEKELMRHIRRCNLYFYRMWWAMPQTKYYKARTKLRSVASFIVKTPLVIHSRLKGDVYYWSAKTINELKKYSFDHSELAGHIVSPYNRKDAMHRSMYDGYVKVEFEGHEFYAMQGWHEYLTGLYGDYMQLPPIEQRVSRHNFDAYWR